jgi:hypothetical protein
MSFLKKQTNQLSERLFQRKAIQVMCWDSKTDGEIHFYLRLQSYPPIGALINMETNSNYSKLNHLKFKVLEVLLYCKR